MFIHTNSPRFAAAALACIGLVGHAAAQSPEKKGEKESVDWFPSVLAVNGPDAPCEGLMIAATDHASGDFAGSALAMCPNYLLMGAPANDNPQGTNAGAAYLYLYSSGAWFQIEKLLPAGLASGDWFGSALDMNDQLAAVGAQYADSSGADAGEVVPYHRSGNLLLAEPFITAWDGAAQDHFGAKVALGTDWLVIAAPWKTVSGQSVGGKIYAYRRFGSSWGWHQDFTLPQVHAFDGLGSSLDMVENTFAAGATGVDVNGNQDAGAVLIGSATLISGNPFAASWGSVKITANDPQPGAHFGASVAMSGNYLYVSAPDADNPGHPDDGAVYVFKNTSFGFPNYQQVARLTHLNMEAHFGRSIAVDGSTLVVTDANGNVHIYSQADTNPPSAPTLTGINWAYTALNTTFGGNVAIAGGQIAASDSLYSLSVGGSDGAAFILQPPANDACADAVTIGQGIFSGCTVMATNDGASGCSPGDTAHDVWYKIIGDANSAGPWLVYANSGFDSLISVHSGCPATTANELTCDDDHAGNLDGVVRFNVQAGNTYLIRMTGYYTSAGPYQLIARKNTCPADIAPLPMGDGVVNIDDLVMVITHWGNQYSMADITGNHFVDIDDLVKVITSWGNCP